MFNGCADLDEDQQLVEELGSEQQLEYQYASVEELEANVPVRPGKSSGPMIVLGDTLPNPYAVAVMRAAYDKLVGPRSRKGGSHVIDTTHLYVRFLPKGEMQVEQLVLDSTIELFDHPLLREIEQSGGWYSDPSLPEGAATWQYSVVAADEVLPQNIETEILSYLFMGNEEQGGVLSIGETTWGDLEYEAQRLVGDTDDDANATAERGGGKVNPRGSLGVERVTGSNVSGARVPLVGIKVRARRGLKYGTAHTGYQGQFRIDTRFRYKFRYSVEFESTISRLRMS